MANPKVTEYIKKNLNNGIGIEDIKSSLRQSGWPEEDIKNGVEEVQGVTPTPGPDPQQTKKPEEKKKGHKKLIVALIIFVIILILFIYVAVSIVSDFKEMFPGAGDMIPIAIPGFS